MLDRRAFLLAAAAATATACSETQAGRNIGRADPSPTSAPDFAPVLASLGAGARLGVAALDTGSGRTLGHDVDGRYAMCSTFKLPLAAAILAAVEAGRMALDEPIAFGEADLLSYAPVIRAHLAEGRLPVERLCAAIVEVSDNSAANLLLRRIGGPAGLTAFVRRNGDTVTRLDRYEEELNTNIPGDLRDTTTPAAMVGLMRTLLLGDGQTPASRARLAGWMVGATTGLQRLRAGMPADWRVGDKTGNGANGAANDLAIAWPPGRAPILIASYMSGVQVDDTARHAAHAEVGRIVAAAFA
ncbi:MAG: class A beta-lactamase [Allosphingosinicella sp.]